MGYFIGILVKFGLLIVFLNVLIEQGGLPLPAIPTLMTAAALANGSYFRLSEIVAAGTLASLIADIAWYWGGKRYGRRVLGLLCKITISPDSCVRQAQSLFVRIGPWSLLFSKIVPGFSNINVALAGVAGVSLTRFVLLDGMGALIFVGTPVVLGHTFRGAISDAIRTIANIGKLGVAGIILALIVYFSIRWWQRIILVRQLRMDRITVGELIEMLTTPTRPLLLDVRPREERLEEGIIPGSIPAHPADPNPFIDGYPRELEIIVYCSCPNEASSARATKHLKQAGFKRIRPLLGGMNAWAGAGQPVHKAE